MVFTKTGVSRGIETTSVAIEKKSEILTLIPTTAFGAPAPKELAPDKRDLIGFEVPQIKLEDSIQADQIQGVREFGTNRPLSVPKLLNSQMRKLAARHDLTLEYHRLGAIRGVILDANPKEGDTATKVTRKVQWAGPPRSYRYPGDAPTDDPGMPPALLK